MAEALRQAPAAAAATTPTAQKPAAPTRPSTQGCRGGTGEHRSQHLPRVRHPRYRRRNADAGGRARTGPRDRQRSARARLEGNRRRPRRPPVGARHGRRPHRWPALDRHGRDRHRRRADAGRLFRLLSPQYRLGRVGDRQPQPAGLQRLQDRARRRDAVRGCHPGALRAHRRIALRRWQRRPADAGHHRRLRAPHHQRHPGRAQAQGRRRLRQRHSRARSRRA